MRAAGIKIELYSLVVGSVVAWSSHAAEPEATAAEAPESETVVGDPVGSPALGVPEANELACTAELDCQDGNVVSCTGSSSCNVNYFYGYVQCDGQRTTCPNFCKATLQHDCGSCGPYFCTCISLVGDCQVGDDSVTCDGIEVQCGCPLLC